MMRIATFTIPLALFAGCASSPPAPRVLTPEIAQQLTAAEVCLGVSTFRPGNAEVAAAEVTRRGLKCEEHAQGMQLLIQQRVARTQAEAAAAAAPVFIPQPYIPPISYTPMLPPAAVHCTSTPQYGGQVNTVCR